MPQIFPPESRDIERLDGLLTARQVFDTTPKIVLGCHQGDQSQHMDPTGVRFQIDIWNNQATVIAQSPRAGYDWADRIIRSVPLQSVAYKTGFTFALIEFLSDPGRVKPLAKRMALDVDILQISTLYERMLCKYLYILYTFS